MLPAVFSLYIVLNLLCLLYLLYLQYLLCCAVYCYHTLYNMDGIVVMWSCNIPLSVSCQLCFAVFAVFIVLNTVYLLYLLYLLCCAVYCYLMLYNMDGIVDM